jgi:uncharacterized protein with PIN domain
MVNELDECPECNMKNRCPSCMGKTKDISTHLYDPNEDIVKCEACKKWLFRYELVG